MLKIKKNFVMPRGTGLLYWRYRVLRPLLKLNYWLFKLNNKNTPWLAQDSIMFLSENLNKDMIGLEYGSGYSTIYLANLSKLVVSVEHNKEWYEKIDELIKEKRISNIEYIFCEENASCEKTEQEVIQLLSEMANTRVKTSYLAYINIVNQFENNYFDYIIIDGRARVETFLASFSKLKKGGFIILDNSERDRYKIIHQFMAGNESIYHTTGLTDTTIWIK